MTSPEPMKSFDELAEFVAEHPEVVVTEEAEIRAYQLAEALIVAGIADHLTVYIDLSDILTRSITDPNQSVTAAEEQKVRNHIDRTFVDFEQPSEEQEPPVNDGSGANPHLKDLAAMLVEAGLCDEDEAQAELGVILGRELTNLGYKARASDIGAVLDAISQHQAESRPLFSVGEPELEGSVSEEFEQGDWRNRLLALLIEQRRDKNHLELVASLKPEHRDDTDERLAAEVAERRGVIIGLIKEAAVLEGTVPTEVTLEEATELQAKTIRAIDGYLMQQSGELEDLVAEFKPPRIWRRAEAEVSRVETTPITEASTLSVGDDAPSAPDAIIDIALEADTDQPHGAEPASVDFDESHSVATAEDLEVPDWLRGTAAVDVKSDDSPATADTPPFDWQSDDEFLAPLADQPVGMEGDSTAAAAADAVAQDAAPIALKGRTEELYEAARAAFRADPTASIADVLKRIS